MLILGAASEMPGGISVALVQGQPLLPGGGAGNSASPGHFMRERRGREDKTPKGS